MSFNSSVIKALTGKQISGFVTPFLKTTPITEGPPGYTKLSGPIALLVK